MINYEVDSDGIATITWDMPGRSMNVLSDASTAAFSDAIEKIKLNLYYEQVQ